MSNTKSQQQKMVKTKNKSIYCPAKTRKMMRFFIQIVFVRVCHLDRRIYEITQLSIRSQKKFMNKKNLKTKKLIMTE